MDSKTPLLVVEDDGLSRLNLVDTLGDAGYRFIEAGNADQAWVLFEKTKIAALVTDLDMPGSMDGMELARRVCKRLPECRVVVISGGHRPDTESLPNDAKFLTKPVGDKELFNALEQLGATA